MIYQFLIKPILFRFDPEKVHHFTFNFLKQVLALKVIRDIVTRLYKLDDPTLTRKVFGLTFKNPVGLAAGFDKDAKLFNELSAFGFSFIEIGTLTPKGQSGNPKPRLFRLPLDKALVNRMGFNNEGVEAAVERLKRKNSDLIIGGNIGKNKLTPNDNAVDDYLICFEALYKHVDYFVVNVSSPNTPNLRSLQEKEPLRALLSSIQRKNNSKTEPKPLLLKIAPDLSKSQLDDVLEIVSETKLDGIIATNTTIDRSNLKTKEEVLSRIGNGGLSGKPLEQRSTEIIRYISSETKGQLPIIAVGGIYSAKDAKEKLDAGASLVQVYSGFVYEGPSLVKRINKGLINSQ